MSIRPIDQTTMVTKVQDISANRQAEISKGENIIHNINLEQQKNIEASQMKVIDTEETRHNKISDENKRDGSGDYKPDKREKNKDEAREDEKTRAAASKIKGTRVDIRI